MPAANILQALVPFQQLLEAILVFEQAHLQTIGAPSVLRKWVKQSYSFIELSLKQGELLYAQVVFEISQDKAILQKVYVSDRSREGVAGFVIFFFVSIFHHLILKNGNPINLHVYLRDFGWSCCKERLESMG